MSGTDTDGGTTACEGGADAVKWQRILLKLSGEAFAGGKPFGLDGPTLSRIADDIVEARNELDVQVADFEKI